ncbi:DUF2927 domain-containing protein [Actinoplanes sp. HUAS TT8]|uniref:DUF2927 domain-containing protein n=1 Tax=Actinoplanes sp. HUAS TT8 TaxID=3447453 RepID=UPI003F51ED28
MFRSIRRVLPVLLLATVALAGCKAAAHQATTALASAAPAPSASVAPSATTPPPAPVKPRVSKAGLTYFFAVAFGADSGDKYNVVTKWFSPQVTVRVHGGNAASRSCLDKVISDFNGLTATTDLKLTTAPADIELHFVPKSKFKSIDPRAGGGDASVSIDWSDLHFITDAIVLVRSNGITEHSRCVLIREELTRGMGFLKSSKTYRDSVFYYDYDAAATKYSAIDKELIRLMYSGVLQVGDDRKAVTGAVTVK